jgi:hypothetical protein
VSSFSSHCWSGFGLSFTLKHTYAQYMELIRQLYTCLLHSDSNPQVKPKSILLNHQCAIYALFRLATERFATITDSSQDYTYNNKVGNRFQPGSKLDFLAPPQHKFICIAWKMQVFPGLTILVQSQECKGLTYDNAFYESGCILCTKVWKSLAWSCLIPSVTSSLPQRQTIPQYWLFWHKFNGITNASCLCTSGIEFT